MHDNIIPATAIKLSSCALQRMHWAWSTVMVLQRFCNVYTGLVPSGSQVVGWAGVAIALAWYSNLPSQIYLEALRKLGRPGRISHERCETRCRTEGYKASNSVPPRMNILAFMESVSAELVKKVDCWSSSFVSPATNPPPTHTFPTTRSGLKKRYMVCWRDRQTQSNRPFLLNINTCTFH